jgi:hypothetical protein
MKIIRHAKGVNLLFELTKEETQTLETKGVLIKGNYVIVREESKKYTVAEILNEPWKIQEDFD